MSDRLGVKDSVGVEVIRKGSAPAPVADGADAAG